MAAPYKRLMEAGAMKRSVGVLVFCIMLINILNLIGCNKQVDINTGERKKVALVLRTNYGYYWGNLKIGAETAAREFNVDMIHYAPGDEEDVSEQIKMVNQALYEDKVDALLLSACDYKALVEVTEKAYDMGIPVVIIDSEVDTEKIHSYIATDNFKAGEMAGGVLIDVAGKNSNIAIMSFIKGSRNAEQREKGLEKVISKYPGINVVSKAYCMSDVKRAYSLTKDILEENKDINAIVALNEIASEGVALAVEEMKLQGRVKIIAFESTLQEIGFIEKGTIQTTIIQNPFSMGYLGVKSAVDVMDGKQVEKRRYIESKVINKDNMYLPENQKLLFPLIK